MNINMLNIKLKLPRLQATKRPAKKSTKRKFEVSAAQKTISIYAKITDAQDNKKLDSQIMSFLERHIHVKRKGWRCKTCGHIDKMGMKLMDHVEMAHLEASHHPCKRCGKDFNFRGSLRTKHFSFVFCPIFVLIFS